MHECMSFALVQRRMATNERGGGNLARWQGTIEEKVSPATLNWRANIGTTFTTLDKLHVSQSISHENA